MCVPNRSGIRITSRRTQGVMARLVGAKLGSEVVLTPLPVNPITMFSSDLLCLLVPPNAGHQKARAVRVARA
jgi:hypothetical protein